MAKPALWLRATRPWAFSASVTSALLAGPVAVVHGGVRLNVPHYLLAALAAVCAHAAANLLNDYFDFRAGVDRPGTLGGSGILPAGLMTPAQVLLEGIIFGGIALALGVYFVTVAGRVLWPLIAGGLILGAGYSMAPAEFKYRGLGDLAVFLAYGIGMTLGGYAIQTHQLSWVAVAYGLPVSFLVTGILHANNMRDVRSDREARTLTLAMRLGAGPARLFYFGLIGLAYVSLILLVAARVLVAPALLACLSAPLALPLLRQAGLGRLREASADAETDGGAALLGLDARTAQLHMVFGLLMLAGVVARILL
jgi:1,4-dihydroxy-2-naphthoate octaprenyltransferase